MSKLELWYSNQYKKRLQKTPRERLRETQKIIRIADKPIRITFFL